MYRDAARVIDTLLSVQRRKRGRDDENRFRKLEESSPNGVGLKALALSDQVRNKSKTYAVVCETLKYRNAIDDILKVAGIRCKQLARSEGLLYSMLYDHLWGRGIQGGGAVKRAILAHDKIIRDSLEKVMAAQSAKGSDSLIAAHILNAPSFPRYARVNLAVATVSDTFEKLRNSGMLCEVDKLINSVLRFPPKTDLHDHPMVKEGVIVLQDKSSCFPAEALRMLSIEHFGGEEELRKIDALDATAAPGNKTSQLAASGFGRVFAFEKNERRSKVLAERMKQYKFGEDRVKICCRDFLSVKHDEDDLSNVRVILLDPSCSGSGMMGRVDHLVSQSGNLNQTSNASNLNNEQDEDQMRIANLSKFQLQCLNHALSFPSVELVSYSTCSVFEEENEGVVRNALSSNPDWELIKAFPSWKRRGISHQNLADSLSEYQADCVIRVDPTKDETNGFFTAIFRRKKILSESQKRKAIKMKTRRKQRRAENRKRRRVN